MDAAGRPWLRHYSPGVPEHLSYPEGTLFDTLRRTAMRFPKRPAIDFFGKTITYCELMALVMRRAYVFRKMGISFGDRVALFLPNCPAFVINAYAAAAIGAIIVPINPMLTKTEYKKIIADAEPKIIITSDYFLPLFGCVLFLRSLLRRDIFPLKSYFSFARFCRRFRSQNGVSHSGSNDTAILVYTSGTTGNPKGVMLTHRNINANAAQSCAWLPTIKRGEETVLSVLPFFHSYGLTVGMHLSVMLGARIVIVPKFSAKNVLKLLKEKRVTIFSVIPAILTAFLKHKELLPESFKHIKVLTCGSSVLNPEVKKEFEDASGARILEGYGLSEASPVTHLMPFSFKGKPGSIGIPFPDTEARLLNIEDETKETGTLEVGELAVRGPQIMKGYWRKPEETARVLKDSWLFTGDLMAMDEGGFFFFIEREDDMIKSGGEKIFPAEVEGCLLRHPAVAEAAVVAIPDSFLGSAVKACIVLQAGKNPDPEEIISFCRNNLASFKVPKEVEFVESLPKNILKKVLRKKLRGNK